MINIDYLRSGGFFVNDKYNKNNKMIENKIKENLGKNSVKRRINYLKMSNALREILIKNKFS